jgi:ABC-2 type transport system ATP-binding protein
MNSAYAIEAEELRKAFGAVQAVRGASFGAARGEILGLLGPNGAGKTTTISMLCGLVKPDSGEAFILGRSLRGEAAAAKSALGLVPQDIALYPDLSARENLEFWGKMYGLRGARLKKRTEEVLATIGLSDRQRDKVGTFSGGMKRRVNIGAAILHEPAVVIMDEPTVGIDPQSRRHILDSVKELNSKGTTVLYTTHYMEEAAELSHRIAIMDKGVVIACGTHDELVRSVGQETRIALALSRADESILAALAAVGGVKRAEAAPGGAELFVEDPDRVLPLLFEAAARISARIASVEVKEPNLESVFLSLTGRALRE